MDIRAELIQACKNGVPSAQKELYSLLSPFLLGVSRRYFNDPTTAEDVMIESMYKILTKLDKYHGEGSFQGWARRICVNECLMLIRKQKVFTDSIDDSHLEIKDKEYIEGDIMAQDILKLIDKLPAGYRTIFNMYVIEGYKHREIAEKLDISINTSKSQLILAKKKLKKNWELLNKGTLD
jgi:RNA polymerase sigma factor (sigma-70 family)